MDSNKDFPKVLIISDATWSNSNNIGNTYTNLFGDWPQDKIAMLYTRTDLPENSVCSKYFQIAENRLIKSIFNKNIKTGVELSTNYLQGNISSEVKEDQETGERIYSFFRKFRWNIFLDARNLLWKTTNWKTKELDGFIDSFNPDVIFLLACSQTYMNDIQRYVISITKKKTAIYFVDDIYSKRCFSLSPFFWINKLISRRSIDKTVRLCDLVYTIIPKQKEEYDKYLNRECKVLNKGGRFNSSLPIYNIKDTPLKLVFTGNITSGRWETLAKVGYILDRINKNENVALIYIYSQNQLESKVKKAFKSSRSIKFMGGIQADKVRKVQDEADILVHVESLKLKEKLLTRLSFSTKLVDYFERGRCIFAVGWGGAASIDYLKKNDAAIVVDDLNDLEDRLRGLIKDQNLILFYGQKAKKCGEKYHRIEKIREGLHFDLAELSKK
ncbi:hypothetical protein [Sporosarcina sp. FA9]|uniref:hypothetical protein n=1 Tax=Sporosarcina sp. FA9 TaxID=3413030 RepID=UPI003F65DBB1